MLRVLAALSPIVTVISLAAPMAHACPTWSESERTGVVEDSTLDEISGIVASRRHSGHFWVHEDSGNPAKIYLLDRKGRVVSQTELNASVQDLEDIAFGPCGDEECLYLADIGDNASRRESVALLRFPEPPIGESSVTPEVLEFRYEDGARDSEAFFVDPRDGIGYLVEKSSDTISPIYALDPDADELIAARVGSIETNEDFIYPNQITGADISADGQTIALRSYIRVYSLCRGEGSVSEALALPLETTIPPPLKQAEAIGFDEHGDLWLTSERLPVPLIRLFDAAATAEGDVGVGRDDAGVPDLGTVLTGSPDVGGEMIDDDSSAPMRAEESGCGVVSGAASSFMAAVGLAFMVLLKRR